MKKIAFILSLCFLVIWTGCQNTSQPPDAPDPSGFTDWEYIEAKGELIIGHDIFAPMGFFDDNGNVVGFDIDLAIAVCEQLGITPVFRLTAWPDKQAALDDHVIDCIWNGMSVTPSRAQSMTMTRAYLQNRIIVMAAPGVDVMTKEDLIPLAVGILGSSADLERVVADPIWDKLQDVRQYPNYTELLAAMDAGEIEAIVVDEIWGNYEYSRRMLSSQSLPLFQITPVDFGADAYAVGFRKEDTHLAEKIGRAINELISTGEVTELSMKWFGEDIVARHS